MLVRGAEEGSRVGGVGTSAERGVGWAGGGGEGGEKWQAGSNG